MQRSQINNLMMSLNISGKQEQFKSVDKQEGPWQKLMKWRRKEKYRESMN